MISFIVIGKNEEKNLRSCFNAIYATIKQSNLAAEIVYVDSNSTDQSMDIAKEFEEISIYKITQNESPAAGRNVGAKNANGDILFFIDGDMIINPSFVKFVIPKFKDKNVFLTGTFVCIDSNGKEHKQYSIDKDTEITIDSYGCFIVAKHIWCEMEGMELRFNEPAYEDYDFFARARLDGYKMTRVNEIMATHYLDPYQSAGRMWTELFSAKQIKWRAFYYRRNFFNPYIYKMLLRNEYSLFSMLLAIAMSVFIHEALFLLIYPSILLIRSILRSKQDYLHTLRLIPYYLIRDIGVLGAFLSFFPSVRRIKYAKFQ